MDMSKWLYVIMGLTGIVTILVGMQLEDYVTSKTHSLEDSVPLYLMFPAIILCFLAIGLIHKDLLNKKQKVGVVE